MAEFSKINIPKALMEEGILFVWVEKEYIQEVCVFFEKQQFYYIENVCWVMLDKKMRKGNT